MGRPESTVKKKGKMEKKKRENKRKRAKFNLAKGGWGKNPGLPALMNNPGAPRTKGTPMVATTAPQGLAASASPSHPAHDPQAHSDFSRQPGRWVSIPIYR